MNNYILILVLLLNALVSSFSQVLLKKSAIKNNGDMISQYINPYVIISYILFLVVLFVNIFAMRFINMSVVSVFSEAVSIVFTLFMCHVFLNERLSTIKLLSMVLIIIGVILIVV